MTPRSASSRWVSFLPVVFALLAIGIGGYFVVGPVGADDAAASSDAVPTFYADVMPIVQENCVECHQPAGLNAGGMVAPMSFLTYEETSAWAPAIADAVREGRMPPWHAAREHEGTFVGERYLSEREQETLITWAEGGTPAGDPDDAPPPVEFPERSESGWWIGEPDLVVEFDEPFVVEDSIHDLYVNIPVQITEEQLPEDRWVKARETRAGSPAVHHVLGALEGLAPGRPPTVYPDGYASLLEKGPRRIVFRMHYNKQPGPGTAVEDRTASAALFYEEGDTIRHVVEGRDLGMFDFAIPPGASNYSDSTEYEFEEDMLILRFSPHMHLRGKAAKYEITYPDGESEVLLHVPNYDFSWQHQYQFQEPVFAPEGSVLKVTLWWDNSEDNPHNPDPTREVTWGLPTYDEMGYGFMQVTEAEPREIIVGEPIPDDVRALEMEGEAVSGPEDAG